MTHRMIDVYDNSQNYKDGDPPQVPTVYLTTNQYIGERDGFPLLSSSLTSADEVDEVVDSLIAELKKSRVKAKQILQKQRLNGL